MTNTAIVIRDYSTIDGGGHAVAHVATCGKIQGLAVADPGVFLTDRRFFGHLVSTAIAQFRKGLTVPVEVRECECAQRHAARQARRAAARLAELIELEG